MSKAILITGSTDGIGLATANMLVTLGHHVLRHGRNPGKLEKTQQSLSTLPGAGRVESYVADLSHLPDVAKLDQAVTEKHTELDVLINNAGVPHAKIYLIENSSRHLSSQRLVQSI